MSIARRIVLLFLVSLTVIPTAISQTSTWKASIVSVSPELPEWVTGTDSRKPAVPIEPYWPGRPTGHRWVTLTVQLTSPAKDSSLAASGIRVTDKDGSYPVTAVGYRFKPKDSIVYLPLLILSAPYADRGMMSHETKDAKDRIPKVGGGWSTLYVLKPGGKGFDVESLAFYEKMDPGKMLFRVLLNGANGRELILKKSPLDVVLLFAVPDGAATLQLKVGDAEPVSVPGLP